MFLMMNKILRRNIYRLKRALFFSYTPNWVVFLIDVFFSISAIFLAALLVVNFNIRLTGTENLFIAMIAVFSVRITGFCVRRTYAGIIRFTGISDVLKLFSVITMGSIIFFILNLGYFLMEGSYFVSMVFFVFEYIFLLISSIFSRFIIRIFFLRYINIVNFKENIVICGSGQNGFVIKNALDNVKDIMYNVVAFVDENAGRKALDGINIYHPSKLETIFSANNVQKLIMAKPIKDFSLRQKMLEACFAHKVEIMEIPKFEKWVMGELSVRQMRPIKIERLLERGEIRIDENDVRNQLLGKVVLITGAGGSIGSEMLRQLIRFNPAQLIVFDQVESPLYDIELELKEQFHISNYKIEIGDIQDKERLEQIFFRYRPDIIYHAAAYKHVPMVEMHPIEGVKTNIFGTKNVADAAVKYGAEKFVMISTDKAVNPTNVMGATKRVAEIYIQSLNVESKTKFITTRFGNVLGSNGSVIPRFKKQIEEGGPITVTDPEVTRFFMTIPEACQLVLQAGAIGDGGEIFVFDMGESVKIVDLARNMIRLSGFEVGKDIQIVFTGLRPGEKLYEEVLSKKEEVLNTEHEKIHIARVRRYNYEDVKRSLAKLEESLHSGDNFEVVRRIKYIVPEFRSQNSVYERLDAELKEERGRGETNEFLMEVI